MLWDLWWVGRWVMGSLVMGRFVCASIYQVHTYCITPLTGTQEDEEIMWKSRPPPPPPEDWRQMAPFWEDDHWPFYDISSIFGQQFPLFLLFSPLSLVVKFRTLSLDVQYAPHSLFSVHSSLFQICSVTTVQTLFPLSRSLSLISGCALYSSSVSLSSIRIHTRTYSYICTLRFLYNVYSPLISCIVGYSDL